MLRFLSALMFLLISSNLIGQSKVYVGIKGGGHVSTIYMEHTIFNTRADNELITGFHVGAVTKIFTNQRPGFLNTGLQIGIDFDRKGWRQQFLTDEPDHFTRLNYLELPIEAIIYAGKGKSKYFFTMGIFLEYLLSTDIDPSPDLDNIGLSEYFPVDIEEDRRFGYGGRFSGGLHQDTNVGTFHLEAFFNISMRGLLEVPELSDRTPDQSNQYVIGFSVGYLIPFGKMEF